MDDTPIQHPGVVELEDLRLTREPHLEESTQFLKNEERLKDSEEIVRALSACDALPLERLLTAALDRIMAASGIDGLMIASQDGFPVALSSGLARGDILAAVSSLFQSTVCRARDEGVIPSVEEMQLRGFAGEQVVVRFFPGMEQRFVLVAYSSSQRPHRRATAKAVRECGQLLQRETGPAPVKNRKRIDKRKNNDGKSYQA